MTIAAPGAVVEAPQLTTPKISLITSADVVTDNSRWEAGYSFSPEGCGTGGGIGEICPSPGTLRAATANPGIVDFVPFYVYAAEKCSTWGARDRDFYARARRKLAVTEAWYLENEFMRDTLALGNSPVASAGATIVTSGALCATNALSRIETAIGDCSRGGRMMIHVRPGILTLLANNGAVRREGNVWLTPTDNIVVPGRGYPGTGPAGQAVGASEWIYVTSMVQIRHGEIVMNPEQADKTADNPQGIPAAAIDRYVNDIFVTAERIVSAAWDPSCCHLAAEVTRVAC